MSFSFARSVLLTLVTGVVLTLALAACGGGDDTATTTAKPAATQAAASTAQTTAAGGTTQAATTAPTATTNSGGSGDAVTNACGLITQDQIATVTGDTVIAGRQGGSGNTCDWDGTKLGVGVSLEIDTSSASADVFAAGSSDSGVVVVDGIGDKAHWDPSISTLEILKGDNDITIQIIDVQGSSATEDNAKALAAIIVPAI